jgi:hypothetical protein
MANFTVTPNMSMNNPTVGVDTGPDYANNIKGAIDIIDAHDHTGGPTKGINIVSAAININADLTINSNNLTNIRSTRFTQESATLSGGGDVGCLYDVNGDLYWNNGSGTAVKVTSGTAINVAGASNQVYPYTTIATNWTILNTDTYVLLDTDTTLSRSITLPLANSVTAGRYYIIKDKTGSAATNNITILRAGSDTLDGATSFVINGNYASQSIMSDGVSSWRLVRHIIPMVGDVTGTNAVSTVAKIQGNAVISTTLSATQDGYVMSWVNGSGQIQYIKYAGDVTGSPGASTVVAIQGNAVKSGALGSAQDGYVLEWINASSQAQWKPLSTGTVNLAGDVTGTTATSVVSKIDGATVPAAGSLTTGNVLQVSGSSALSYSPVNLAGGTNYVSGALPTANQVSQSMGGDVNGTTAASTVVAITGSASAVPIASTGNIITWASTTTAPGIKQSDLATGSGTGATLTIQAQNETGTTSIGGGLTLKSGTGTSTTGTVTIAAGSTTMVTATTSGVVIGTSTTNQTYSGGVVDGYTVIAGTSTIGDGYDIILINSAASRTINLPNPASCGAGSALARVFMIKDKSGTLNTNPATLVRFGSELIDGYAGSKTLNSNYGTWTLLTDGINWWI